MVMVTGENTAFTASSPGDGVRSGKTKAVDDEVAVVHALAEVAAIGEVPFARRGELGDPVVDPFPDEPAVQPRVPVEQLGVLGQPAGPVAHGVPVFAQDHGQAAAVRVVLAVRCDGFLPPADRVELVVPGVHPAVDVGVEGVGFALIVNQPARVPAADPLGHPLEVAADPGLVAQRPHDHAGMVLVPLDGALDPVQVGRPPPRVAAGVVPPAREGEPVGFQVALVDHQQPVLVAQVEEPRVGRIMTGPHRVDVVPFHQHDVRPHGRLVQAAAGFRMPLVPVHAAEPDDVPVEPDLPVADLDAAEPDPEPDVPAGAGQDRVVQAGVFVRPGLGRDVPARGRAGTGLGAGDAEFRYRQRGRAVGVDAEDADTVAGVVVGVHEEVPDRPGRLVDQGDAAEDAGQPPHVLVLQVGPGRPLVHADRDDVVFEPNELGDIELPDQPAALAVADDRTIDEHGEARVHPVEADDGRPAGVPVRRQREAPPVLPRRVAVGDVRRVDREGIGHVGVRRGAVPGRAGDASQLPARGHGDVVEPAVVEVRGLESRGQVARATAVAELPAPVQAELADPGGLGCPRRGMTLPGAERLDVAQVRGGGPISHAGCLSFPGGIPLSVVAACRHP
jgi:hypothetical protein